MKVPDLVVDAADKDGEKTVADLAARKFSDTFAAVNSADDMQSYLSSNFSRRKIRATLDDRRSTFLLAKDSDRAVVYAHWRSDSAPPLDLSGRPAELVRPYVDADYIGRGIGSALMRVVLDQAADRGHELIWLGVWQNNGRAIAYYRKWGFQVEGEKTFALGGDLQTDYVIVRGVPASS